MIGADPKQTPTVSDDQAALLDFLRERDVPCPVCKYNLRALTSDRCPECGRTLKLAVGTIEQRLGAYIVTLVCSLLPGGPGVLFAIIVIDSGFPSTADSEFASIMAIGIGSWVAMALALAAILLRRRILRMSPPGQWLLAGVAALNLAIIVGAIILLFD